MNKETAPKLGEGLETWKTMQRKKGKTLSVSFVVLRF